MVNASQAQEIANLILGSSSATTYLNTDSAGRINVTAGGRVGQIVNAPAGGVEVPDRGPRLAASRHDRRPHRPGAVPAGQHLSSVLEYRSLRDTAQFDYGISRLSGPGGGPRKEFEIRSVGAFVCRAPLAMGVLSNVG